MNCRTQQTQPLWGIRRMEEATPPPQPSPFQPPPSYAPTHQVRDKLYKKDNYLDVQAFRPFRQGKGKGKRRRQVGNHMFLNYT